MIIVGNAYLSDDIVEKQFVCDLLKCKGACCVEGDSGAPLDANELPIFEEIYEKVKPYMTLAGQQVVEQQGVYVIDSDGDYNTPVIEDRECAYAVYDQAGILKCAVEQAYLAGDITYHKPISCHLYPIRITAYEQFDAVNYDRWDICSPACSNGEALKVPVYKFLKNPLIRKYGAEWYRELENQIDEMYTEEGEV